MRYGLHEVRLDRIIAQTLAVNAASRAVAERWLGSTYVCMFSTSMTGDVEGLAEGEVEYAISRKGFS